MMHWRQTRRWGKRISLLRPGTRPQEEHTAYSFRSRGGNKPRRIGLASLSMKELLEAGVHFGHQTRRWNPKMKRYIYGARNGIYIIDLHQTLKLYEDAQKFVQEIVTGPDGKGNGRVLFVGTKKQAQDAI